MNNRIINLIKDKYPTQKTFVAEFNLKYPSAKITEDIVTNWAKGKSESYKKFAGELAEFFNVTTDFLYFGSQQILPSDEMKLLKYYRSLSEDDKITALGDLIRFVSIKKEENAQSQTETSFEIGNDISPRANVYKLGVNRRE